MSDWNSISSRMNTALPFSYQFCDTDTFPQKYSRGGYDETPFNAFSYGGIGTGNFGRDLHGHFSRWHLQNGHHLNQQIDAARIGIRWSQNGKSGYHQLGSAGWKYPLPKGSHKVQCLFPMRWESVNDSQLPFSLIVESFSPVIPHNYKASCLPVVFFDFHVKNTSPIPLQFDAAFFWPNLLGFKPSFRSPNEREKKIWPDHSHAGCINRKLDNLDTSDSYSGIVYERNSERPVLGDMEGQWLLCATGLKQTRYSCELQYNCNSPGQYMGIANQKFSLEHAENTFIEQGKFPQNDCRWHAHWEEPIGGALSSGQEIAPEETACISFCMVWDLPLVQFGLGRIWEKKYTAQFGSNGTNAAVIASYCLKNKEQWKNDILSWHKQTTDTMSSKGELWNVPVEISGMLINELYYVVDGGSTWVNCARPHPHLAKPNLGENEHFSILEGFDSGYYFYGTEDLWPHSFVAFLANWPDLAKSFFDDFMNSASVELTEKRPIYKTSTVTPLKVQWKIPHDLGSPPEDPWHLINAYNYNNDSNLWKDHNPAFIITYYLFKKRTGLQINANEWDNLKKIADFFMAQDKDGDGLPEHDTFGDSTWDAFEMRGVSSYSGGFVLAALAAMEAWSIEMKDTTAQKLFSDTRNRAQAAYNEQLWTGEYYKLDKEGKFNRYLIADALLGPFIAKLAGLGDLLPAERVKAHLQSVYEKNFKGFMNGTLGPAFIGRHSYVDMQEGAQISEVMVGSSWACAGMMFHYGMHREALELIKPLHEVLYVKSGLQFMTPAAWNSKGNYRAPLNLRPLAIWYLYPKLSKGN